MTKKGPSVIGASTKGQIKYIAPDTASQIIFDMLCNASRESPSSKLSMMSATGKNERGVRLCIEHMRDQGIRVVGTSDKAGYFIAETETEYQKFRRNYMSKATTIIRRVRAMDATDPDQLDVQMNLLDFALQEIEVESNGNTGK
jgi:hypothetical protein